MDVTNQINDNVKQKLYFASILLSCAALQVAGAGTELETGHGEYCQSIFDRAPLSPLGKHLNSVLELC